MERHRRSSTMSDPAHPRYVWHIPNEVNASPRSVSVVYDFGPDKHDYLDSGTSRPSDRLTFQVWDITTRDSDPSKISDGVGDRRHAAQLVRTGLRREFIDAPKPPENANYPEPRAHKRLVVADLGSFLRQRERGPDSVPP